MATYSDVEEELLAQQQEEEDRTRVLEEQRQQERLQNEQNGPLNTATNLAKDYAKSVVKTAAKEEAVAAAATAGSAIAASAPVWAPIAAILAAIILVIGLGIFVIISLTSACNADGLSGTGTRTASWLASFLPGVSEDVCSSLTVSNSFQGGLSGGAGAAGPFDDLTHLTSLGIPVKSGVDDRVTLCMSGKVRAIFALAGSSKPPIDIEITDAYRPPGSTTAGGRISAHSRGEAVDISLRSPIVPWNQATHSLPAGYTDSRISQLVSIATSVFPNGVQSNTLDEYHNPAANASAGHVHVEFNIPPGGGSYCNGTS